MLVGGFENVVGQRRVAIALCIRHAGERFLRHRVAVGFFDFGERRVVEFGAERHVELQPRAFVGWKCPLAFLGDLHHCRARHVSGVERQL